MQGGTLSYSMFGPPPVPSAPKANPLLGIPLFGQNGDPKWTNAFDMPFSKAHEEHLLYMARGRTPMDALTVWSQQFQEWHPRSDAWYFWLWILSRARLDDEPENKLVYMQQFAMAANHFAKTRTWVYGG